MNAIDTSANRRGISVPGVDVLLMLTYHLHDSKLDVKSATVTDRPGSFASWENIAKPVGAISLDITHYSLELSPIKVS
ncbi:hypothetical protein G6F37_004127 [Rhizopus arrhizus]|nr:hypothetical protein G6F38_011450 [Rhizopus arrhizus]KAG1160280.1 hypothetical protein G6F37_004127 [Rhizopus arrhizus]